MNVQSMDEYLRELSTDTCLSLLRSAEVGRIGMIVDGSLVVVPVNYRAVGNSNRFSIVIRTRPGSIVDQAHEVAFELDGVDPLHATGWSVLVQGVLSHISEIDIALMGDALDPKPWISNPASWVVIGPTKVTGRMLQRPLGEWVIGAGYH